MNTRRFFMMATFGLSLATASTLLFAQTATPATGQPAAVQPQGAPRAGAVFAALDTNKDKALSLQEFQAGYAALQRAITLEVRLREQFRTVDADHSGAIEAGEYANLALVKHASKTAPTLSIFDADRNQKLDFAEYLAVIRRLAPAQPTTPAK